MITITYTYREIEKVKEVAKELREKYKSKGLIVSSSGRDINIKEDEVISKELNELELAKELKNFSRKATVFGTLYLNETIVFIEMFQGTYCYKKNDPDFLYVMEQDTKNCLYGTEKIFMQLILELGLLEKASTELITLLVIRTAGCDYYFEENYRKLFYKELERRLGVNRDGDQIFASAKFEI